MEASATERLLAGACFRPPYETVPKHAMLGPYGPGVDRAPPTRHRRREGINYSN